MNDSIYELVALVMFFFACASLYFVFILQPRNEALYEIMDCMGSDRSHEAYESCRKAGPSSPRSRASP